MSEITRRMDMPAEHMRKIFGMQDAYLKKLEKDFHVVIVDRNGSVSITGEAENVDRVQGVLRQLTILSEREMKSRNRTWIMPLRWVWRRKKRLFQR